MYILYIVYSICTHFYTFRDAHITTVFPSAGERSRS